MKKYTFNIIKYAIKYSLSSLIVLVSLWLVAKNFNGPDIKDAFLAIHTKTYVLIGLSFFLLYSIRAVRIYILGHLNAWGSFLLAITHIFFSTIVPFRLGEYAHVSKNISMGAPHGRAVAELITIKLADFFAVGVISGFGLFSSTIYVNYAGVLGICIAVLCMTMFFLRRHIHILVPSRFKGNENIIEFLNYINSINKSVVFKLMFMTFLLWMVSFAPWILIKNELGLQIGISSMAVAWIFSVIGSSIPNIFPGGIGSVHAGWIGGLALVGISLSQATTFATVSHAISIIFLTTFFILTTVTNLILVAGGYKSRARR